MLLAAPGHNHGHHQGGGQAKPGVALQVLAVSTVGYGFVPSRGGDDRGQEGATVIGNSMDSCQNRENYGRRVKN